MSQQLRDYLLDFACEGMRAEGREITVESIKANGIELGVPDDFFDGSAEDQREVDAALARVAAGAPAQAPTPIDANAMKMGEIVAENAAAVSKSEPEPEQRPARSLLEAQSDLGNARATARAATDTMQRAREVFARALLRFQVAYGATLTPAELNRQFAKSEQETRRKIATGEIEPTRMTRKANTYIDRANGRGGTADDFARQQMRTGHRRGAAPGQMQGGYSPAHDQRLKVASEQ